jgi:hypothetical protein
MTTTVPAGNLLNMRKRRSYSIAMGLRDIENQTWRLPGGYGKTNDATGKSLSKLKDS